MSERIDELMRQAKAAIDIAADAAEEEGVELDYSLLGIQMWRVGSDQDGYFAGIEIARTEAEARQLAWLYFKERRKNEYTDWSEGQPMHMAGVQYEWQNYHSSADELTVTALGCDAYGADGEGNLELE